MSGYGWPQGYAGFTKLCSFLFLFVEGWWDFLLTLVRKLTSETIWTWDFSGRNVTFSDRDLTFQTDIDLYNFLLILLSIWTFLKKKFGNLICLLIFIVIFIIASSILFKMISRVCCDVVIFILHYCLSLLPWSFSLARCLFILLLNNRFC